MQLIAVTNIDQALTPERHQQLEQGEILFFPQTPTRLSEDERHFLLGQKQTDAAYHKNVAYRPGQDKVTGLAKNTDSETLRRIMKNYCQGTAELLTRLMPQYARNWRLDFTSYRPQEEAGRKASLHARNDLLHVDAFPTRPTNGDRIMRFFTNINPDQNRVWLTGEDFEALAQRFEGEIRQKLLPKALPSGRLSFRRLLGRAIQAAGTGKTLPSPYDKIMHRFHNFLKENGDFQTHCPKTTTEFPPNSSWIVFTDTVSHAVLSGQYALEQTFIISRKSLYLNEKAPVSILENLCRASLTLNAGNS